VSPLTAIDKTRGFSFYSFEWELLLPVRFMCDYILAILLGNRLLQPWRKVILASMDLTSTRTTWLSLHSTTTCKSKIARCLKLNVSKWIRFSCHVMRYKAWTHREGCSADHHLQIRGNNRGKKQPLAFSRWHPNHDQLCVRETSNEMIRRLIEERQKKVVDPNVNASSSSGSVNFVETNN
jgi:hypothetical protein